MELQAELNMTEARDWKRTIGIVRGKRKGPTMVFLAGIHGNEQSGVLALESFVDQLNELQDHLAGTVMCIAGNLPALAKGDRFVDRDLNRMWSADRIKRLKDGTFIPRNADEEEQVALCTMLMEILRDEAGPFYFMDLHTTSSPTIPFLVVNDCLLNRNFTQQYPLPIILGIEEYLNGPLLSYINELGYVAFGFEGGQHNDPASVNQHLAFARLSIAYCSMLPSTLWNVEEDEKMLKAASRGVKSFYEIFFRYKIREDEAFQMMPGFINFQRIERGQTIAQSNDQPIVADRNARIFMPLYQAQGSEGFFAVRPIPSFFLRLSAILRNRRADRLLTWLPGVDWASERRDALVVDQRVARFFTKQIFHLLGYRSRRRDQLHFVMHNREAASRDEEYVDAVWMK